MTREILYACKSYASDVKCLLDNWSDFKMLYVQKSCCLFFWSMSVPFTLLHFFALQYLYYCGSQSQAKCFVRPCISVLQEIVPVFLEPVSALQIGAGCHCVLMAPSAIPRGLLPPPGIGSLASSLSLPSNVPSPPEPGGCLCISGVWESPLAMYVIEDSNGKNNKRNQFLRKMEFSQVSSPGPSFILPPTWFL